MGYIGNCGPKGYGFSAVLVINRVSILTDFAHFDHKLVFCNFGFLALSKRNVYSNLSWSELENYYNARLKQVINRVRNIADFGHK